MGDGFAGVGTVVDHEAEAAGEVEFLGDDSGSEEEMAQGGFIGWGGVADAGDHGLGNDQQVNGCGGLDVVDDDAAVVFVFDLGRNLAVDDALKEGLGHTKSSE